ncbi:MAG TPA: PadR family transcriptional regulator, partial [Clostridiales bacterium]|nr:PadR family transcriptional regulator [Clostridiales bacterium]
MKKSIGSGRGSVYNILLKALQTGDKYGYEICKEVEEKTNGVYILKQPSLYSGLKRLEARNEISSYWRDSDLGGRRHYYSLTDAGRKRIENSNFSWEDARDGIVDS